MKRLLFTFLIVFSVGMAEAQIRSGFEDPGHFKVGVNLGAPVGDFNNFSSIQWGIEAAYLWNLAPAFNLGVSASYLNFVGKKYDGIKRTNFGFIPVAATAQYSLMENLFVGADLGYGIGVAPSGNDGGVYYQPKLGYQIDLFEVYLGYKGITKSGSHANAISVGFNYKF